MSDGHADIRPPRHTAQTDADGWQHWDSRDHGRFDAAIGPIRTRVEGERVRVRIDVTTAQLNMGDRVHGGAILTLVDNALFIGARLLGVLDGRGVTADLTAHFVGGAGEGEALDAVVEVVRATGRTVFLRGLVEQGTETIADFTGAIRKLSPPRP